MRFYVNEVIRKGKRRMRESTETHSTHSRHLGRVRFYVSEVICKGKRRMRERERREANVIFPSLTSAKKKKGKVT